LSGYPGRDRCGGAGAAGDRDRGRDVVADRMREGFEHGWFTAEIGSKLVFRKVMSQNKDKK